MNVFSEEDVVTLFFDPEINRFIDEFGIVIHDIFRIITPSQLSIFRRYKNQYLVPDITRSFLVELVYPDVDDDYHQYELGDGEWRGYNYYEKTY